MNPIIDRLTLAVNAVHTDPTAQPLLVLNFSALTASFKGLSPSDDEIFDLSDDDGLSMDDKAASVKLARDDERMVRLRGRIEELVGRVVGVWNGDGEVADVSCDNRLS